ncbi:MAG: tetratricopeptide repeat protein [Candidatus Babeliaceae bacterium]
MKYLFLCIIVLHVHNHAMVVEKKLTEIEKKFYEAKSYDDMPYCELKRHLAYNLYEEVVEQSDNQKLKAEALYRLGRMRSLGRGTQRDYRKAHAYFESAQDLNAPITQAKARWRLAELYFIGLGVAQDYKKAKILFDQVANNTVDSYVQAAARWRLGEMYKNGQGMPIDYKAAHDYLQLAAQQTINKDVKACALESLKSLNI